MKSPLSPSEIEILVRQAQGGNEESFAKLFDTFFDKIFRYVRMRVDEDEAEDMTSEVFLKVVENLARYTPKKNATFSSWIFRIAHNTVIDFYRKKRELLGLPDNEKDDEGNGSFDVPDSEPTPDEQTQKHWEQKKIREILKKLPIPHREILELKYLEGFSNMEISLITGKSEGNIRIIQLRALREMRSHFPET